MKMKMLGLMLALALCSGAPSPGDTRAGVPGWRSDHHMHLASPSLCKLVGDCLESNHPPAVYAADAVQELDEAQVAKGVILSCAYLYGLRSLHLSTNEVSKLTRSENEFTAAEVAKFPGRLVGFFSVDPLQESAVDEIRHWSANKQLVGLKLHFVASAVDIRNPNHRCRVAKVIETAAANRLPMVIHLGGGKFNASDTEIFIRDILPNAGDSWVQIAHAGGGLPSVDGNNLAVLRTFADQIVRNNPSTRHILFDLSYVPEPDATAETVAAIKQQMRRIGMSRFLFGSDFNVLTPRQEIQSLRKLQLSPDEWQILETTCAPWAC